MHLLEIGTHGHTTRCDVLPRSKRYVHDKGHKKHNIYILYMCVCMCINMIFSFGLLPPPKLQLLTVIPNISIDMRHPRGSL